MVVLSWEKTKFGKRRRKIERLSKADVYGKFPDYSITIPSIDTVTRKRKGGEIQVITYSETHINLSKYLLMV